MKRVSPVRGPETCTTLNARHNNGIFVPLLDLGQETPTARCRLASASCPLESKSGETPIFCKLPPVSRSRSTSTAAAEASAKNWIRRRRITGVKALATGRCSWRRQQPAGASFSQRRPTGNRAPANFCRPCRPTSIPWIASFGCTPRYRHFRNGVRDYYRRHYPLTAEARASR